MVFRCNLWVLSNIQRILTKNLLREKREDYFSYNYWYRWKKRNLKIIDE